jgi:xanthine dehydrogenase YagS FAD-binding subunit
MRPFTYERARSAGEATHIAAMVGRPPSLPATDAAAQYLAGGTTLVDLMKLDVMRPHRVVDINALEQTAAGSIEHTPQGVRLGALVRMSDAAQHPEIRRDYPMLVQALELAASPQLRNMASLGGNVLQRTRCTYFRDVSYNNCNKRIPGSGCAALEGFNRQHAVLGASEHCIATYPGDFAQALIALDALVEVAGSSGNRMMPFARLHRMPGDTPHIETVLEPGDLITAFHLPVAPWMARSLFLKIRDRESYEFALASAAVALDLQDRRVREARVALGGLATVPWRSRPAEAALAGRMLDEDVLMAAAEAAFADAEPREHNAFKVALGKRTLMRAVHAAAELEL